MKGYRFERYVFEKFRDAGFYVIASRKSRGVFDVIAIYRGRIYGIQCKVNGKLPQSEKSRILDTAWIHKITPLLAYRERRKAMIKRLDTDETMSLRDFIEIERKKI